MSSTLNIYASGSDLRRAVGTVGLLCEFAPDSPTLQKAERWYGPEQLLGSADAALAIAYPLVSKLLEIAPVIEGLPLFYIFEESMLEQVSYAVQAFHLNRWIDEHGFSTCRFLSYSPWLDRLLQVRQVQQSRYSLVSAATLLQTSTSARALRKLWESRPKPPEAFRRVMPLWSRHLSAASTRKTLERAPSGGIWFYSTAYNYTKIGLHYEPFLPGPLNFLVEEPTTGGKRLRELGRDAYWLYAWSRASDIPSTAEVRSIADQVTSAFAEVKLNQEESALCAVLLQSEWWQHLLTRRLPFGMYNNRVLQRWRKSVAPEMLVVGNAGWERALLLQPGTERLPKVMFQHGIMHWTYAVTDEPVDLFLLRGPFFQRAVNEKLRRKTVLQNFPEPITAPAAQAGHPRSDILFITTPYDVPELFHPRDLHDILRSLVRMAAAARRRLVVRVHPIEKISTYEHAIKELKKELSVVLDVAYSQGPNVEEVLSRTCVAVLHFSTMFLDCLRHGIPIVSFDWHWFPNKRQFQEEGIFHLARDLRDFENLLQQGIAGVLPARKDGLEEFLAPSHPEELKALLKQVWDERQASSVPGRSPVSI
jgi:hypothetical protein